MPLYEYSCPSCGVFSQFAPMSQHSAPGTCPHCGASSKRLISAPALALMPTTLRQAHARSEKSAHEPKLASRRGCGCHGAHTCGQGASSSGGHAEKTKLKSRTGTTRPWMLGH